MSKSTKRTFEIEPQESPSEKEKPIRGGFLFSAERSPAGSGIRISVSDGGTTLFEIEVPASMVKKYPYEPLRLIFDGSSL